MSRWIGDFRPASLYQHQSNLTHFDRNFDFRGMYSPDPWLQRPRKIEFEGLFKSEELRKPWMR